MTSVITIVIARLMEAPVADAVGMVNHKSAIFPVMLPREFTGDGIAINRLFEETDDGNVHAVVMVTAFAADFAAVEHIGAGIVDTLRDGDEEWSHDVEDVQFGKAGPDFTGWDGDRGQFFRSIHFEVRW